MCCAVNENDWHSLALIHLLASLAALLHDLGKACLAFQQSLQAKGPIERNLYRHEWVSLRLFQAFVGDSGDAEWLERLINPSDRRRRELDRGPGRARAVMTDSTPLRKTTSRLARFRRWHESLPGSC
jgi:hypothetical protein